MLTSRSGATAVRPRARFRGAPVGGTALAWHRWTEPGGPGPLVHRSRSTAGVRTREVASTLSRRRSSVRRGREPPDAASRSCPPRPFSIHSSDRTRAGCASRSDAGAVDGKVSRAGRARPRRAPAWAGMGLVSVLVVVALIALAVAPGAAAPPHRVTAAAPPAPEPQPDGPAEPPPGPTDPPAGPTDP